MKLIIENKKLNKAYFDDITIRQATSNDIEAIEKMYEERVTFNDEHNIHQWDKQDVTWEAFSNLYTIENYYVGEVEKEIVGGLFIVDVDALYWSEKGKRHSLFLHKLCVHPKYSARGYSDKLITFFKEKGREEGYPYVCLDVRGYKKKLCAMYERNGFTYHKTIQVHKDFETFLYQFHYR